MYDMHLGDALLYIAVLSPLLLATLHKMYLGIKDITTFDCDSSIQRSEGVR
jgi:hypothetical protein